MIKSEFPSAIGGPTANSRWMALISNYGPGVVLAITIALAAKYVEQIGIAPSLVTALILGLLLSALFEQTTASAGIDLAAKHILSVGVAFLGAHLTLYDAASLGIGSAAIVVAAMLVTLVVSWFVARSLGLSRRIAILAGCGTAICGASATIAASAVLLEGPGSEHDTALVVVSVTTMSAIAMVFYPLATAALGLTEVQSGIVLGGSIHNVPQAVAAGYSVSELAGNSATLIKLFRVALLGPIVVGIALFFGGRTRASASPVRVPWFIIAFVVLMVVGSVFVLPQTFKSLLNLASSWCLLVAVAAIGLKTSFPAVRTVGPRVLALIIANSFALAVILFAAAMIHAI